MTIGFNRVRIGWAAGALTLLVGCHGAPGPELAEGSSEGSDGDTGIVDPSGTDDSDSGGSSDGEQPSRADEPLFTERAALRRLTASQLRSTLASLFGEAAASDPGVLAAIPDDLTRELFANVGASEVLSPPVAVEQYEDLALAVTALVFDDPARREAVVGCSLDDAGCRGRVVADFGRRVWRRPLTVDERLRYGALWEQMRARFGDPWVAGRYLAVALLTSPNFMHLVELGETDPMRAGVRRYTSHEMASRLSYFLWDGPPDEVLLAAAADDALVQPERLAAQVARMLDDPRVARSYRAFFSQLLGLDALDVLTKDPSVFPAASAALFGEMRGEVERIIEREIFEAGGTRRDLLTTRSTFVTPQLAELYGLSVDGPADAEGFSRATLSPADPRQGIFGTAAFLAANARVTRTSPTLRGFFVQQRWLCNALPPPPADVETELPDDPDGAGPKTMRERLAAHAADPECAGCHDLTDPIGLSFEHFDGIGRYRETDRGLTLDVTGELSGVAFEGLSGLAATLAEDPGSAACLVRHAYRYAVGHREGPGEAAVLARLQRQGDAPIREVWAAIATSGGFRHLEVQP